MVGSAHVVTPGSGLGLGLGLGLGVGVGLGLGVGLWVGHVSTKAAQPRSYMHPCLKGPV